MTLAQVVNAAILRNDEIEVLKQLAQYIKDGQLSLIADPKLKDYVKNKSTPDEVRTYLKPELAKRGLQEDDYAGFIERLNQPEESESAKKRRSVAIQVASLPPHVTAKPPTFEDLETLKVLPVKSEPNPSTEAVIPEIVPEGASEESASVRRPAAHYDKSIKTNNPPPFMVEQKKASAGIDDQATDDLAGFDLFGLETEASEVEEAKKKAALAAPAPQDTAKPANPTTAETPEPVKSKNNPTPSTPSEPKKATPKKSLSPVRYYYDHYVNNKSDGRFHLFESRLEEGVDKDLEKRLFTDNSLSRQHCTGDQLKSRILEVVRDDINAITDLDALNKYKENFEKSAGYKILKTGQGICTYFFDLQTDSHRAWEKMVAEREGVLTRALAP